MFYELRVNTLVFGKMYFRMREKILPPLRSGICSELANLGTFLK